MKLCKIQYSLLNFLSVLSNPVVKVVRVQFNPIHFFFIEGLGHEVLVYRWICH